MNNGQTTDAKNYKTYEHNCSFRQSSDESCSTPSLSKLSKQSPLKDIINLSQSDFGSESNSRITNNETKAQNIKMEVNQDLKHDQSDKENIQKFDPPKQRKITVLKTKNSNQNSQLSKSKNATDNNNSEIENHIHSGILSSAKMSELKARRLNFENSLYQNKNHDDTQPKTKMINRYLNSNTIASPDQKVIPLYTAHSSKDTLMGFIDSYTTTYLGEPMDLDPGQHEPPKDREINIETGHTELSCQLDNDLSVKYKNFIQSETESNQLKYSSEVVDNDKLSTLKSQDLNFISSEETVSPDQDLIAEKLAEATFGDKNEIKEKLKQAIEAKTIQKMLDSKNDDDKLSMLKAQEIVQLLQKNVRERTK